MLRYLRCDRWKGGGLGEGFGALIGMRGARKRLCMGSPIPLLFRESVPVKIGLGNSEGANGSGLILDHLYRGRDREFFCLGVGRGPDLALQRRKAGVSIYSVLGES